MSVSLTINGITYNYPVQFDTNWGPTLTAWSTAVTTGMLQKAGGSFPLTADADFGMSFGLKALYLKSEEASIAHTGILRLASQSSGVVFRNTLDSADLVLTTNASNMLTFNGIPLGPPTALLNTHIYVGDVLNQPADVPVSGDISITNTGVVTISNDAITNVKVDAAAAIDRSKLATDTANTIVYNDGSGNLASRTLAINQVLVSDSSGIPTTASPTTTEISYVAGVTSSIQAQFNALTQTPSGSIIDFGGTVAPSGWLVCDGSAVSQTTYAALFAAIGTNWNIGGEGAGNFRLPSFARRASVGSGGAGTAVLGNTVGSTGGSETHTLTTAEIPVVTITDPGHTHTTSGSTGRFPVETNAGGTVSPVYDVAGIGPINQYAGTESTGVGLIRGTITSITTGITAAGGGTSHTIMQPSAVVLKIIKT